MSLTIDENLDKERYFGDIILKKVIDCLKGNWFDQWNNAHLE